MTSVCHDPVLGIWVSDVDTEDDAWYALGYDAPRYPVPAIPRRVGYHPYGTGIMSATPYFYVSTYNYLWTFWKDYGLVVERC